MSDKRNDLAWSITGKRTEAHLTFILDPVSIAGGAACPRTTAIFPQVRKMRENRKNAILVIVVIHRRLTMSIDVLDHGGW